MNRLRKTFCFPIAAGFIASGKWGRNYWLAVRRSISFMGLILHASAIRLRRDELIMVEYVPKRPKSHLVDMDGDSVCCFFGRYRIRRFKLVASGSGDTFIQAARKLNKGAAAPSSLADA